MQRVTDLADPRRCKGASLDGQCQNFAEEGAEYCRVHGGTDQAPALRLKQYLLTRAQDQARLVHLDDPEGVKSLRDEVVIATGMRKHGVLGAINQRREGAVVVCAQQDAWSRGQLCRDGFVSLGITHHSSSGMSSLSNADRILPPQR